MLWRLFPYAAGEDAEEGPLRFSGLRHLRPVGEEVPNGAGDERVRLFEKVPGALLSGRATPNTLVRAPAP